MLIRATERAFQIVSEAAKELPPEIRAMEPGAPWEHHRHGNLLRHEYYRIEANGLGSILRHELPELRLAVLRLRENVDPVTNVFLHGTVHEAGEDLQAAVRSNTAVLGLWERLTPLGRNEFICWVEDAKQAATRQRRIARTCEELLEGKKRPCCWPGCIHRTDKAPSPSQRAVLIDRKGKVSG